MRKTILLIGALILLIQFTETKVCFGQECTHRSVVAQSEPVDPVKISQMIEKEIRRQYWYYLTGSNLLYQGNLNLPGRLMIFYFHRNIVGTFFTIASWDFQGKFSQVNTLVRIGNGYTENVQTNYQPVSVDPFILVLKLQEGEMEIQLQEDGILNVNGQVVSIINDPNVDPTEMQANCIAMSDRFLREHYWYYLNMAQMISMEGLTTNLRTYSLLTYSNIVGTFLVITTCEQDIVKANTFVRLGAGSTTAGRSIIIDPVVLELSN